MRSLSNFARAALVASSLLSSIPLHADEVLRWNRVATDVASRAGTDPFTESRAFAIVQLAVHDAVNSVEPRYATYGPAVPAAKGASAEAAVAAAAHDTLLELFPAARDALDSELREALSAIAVAPAAVSAGVDARRRSGRAVRSSGSATSRRRPCPTIPRRTR